MISKILRRNSNHIHAYKIRIKPLIKLNKVKVLGVNTPYVTAALGALNSLPFTHSSLRELLLSQSQTDKDRHFVWLRLPITVAVMGLVLKFHHVETCTTSL